MKRKTNSPEVFFGYTTTPADLRRRARWAKARLAQMMQAAPPDPTPEDLERWTAERMSATIAAAEKYECQAREWLAEAAPHGGPAVPLLRELVQATRANAIDAKLKRLEREVNVKKFRRCNQNRAAAKRPRPGRAKPMAARITDGMKPYRRDHVAFKVFILAWERETIGGLRLSAVGEMSFSIADENAASEPPVTRTRGTLQKMYSRCG